MSQDAKTKVMQARAGLLMDEPFFATLAMRLEVLEDPTCETAWTDGTTMGYNPKFVEPLMMDELKFILCHEVMHCAMSHQTRRGQREPSKWNQAGDFVVNQILVDAKFRMPEGGLLSEQFRGMNADEVYAKLPDTPGKGGKKLNPQGGKKGKAKGSGGGTPNSGKQPDSEEGKSDDPGKCGEVRDAKGKDGKNPTQTDITHNEEDWKRAVVQAAQVAKSAGRLPRGFDRFVEELIEPVIDWRIVLRRFVEDTARNDYSWSPPSRRHVSEGLYLPSVRSEELAPIVIAVDTSASISNEDLTQFASEVSAIIEEHKTSATVLYCDAGVAKVEEFTCDDLPITLHPKGWGGTDFRPAFKWVEDNWRDRQPSCFIYLTDLECHSFPEKEPAYPVLWAKIGKSRNKPPFGEEVKM